MSDKNLVTAADKNYSLQLGAMLTSLFKSQSTQINVYILGVGWTESDKTFFRSKFEPDLLVNFIDIDPEKFSGVKLSNKFPLATIYNLLAPKYFFAHLDRILYVDSDVIFTKDLSDLYSQPMSSAVSAVVDSHVGLIGNPTMWRPWREVGSNPQAKYLNTGVMLIDPKKWNENEITDRCLDLLTQFRMPCIDQDALSLVLNGDFESLDPKFNQMPFHFMPRIRFADIFTDYTAIAVAKRDPSIIHFHRSFFGKPWNLGCSHPHKNEWRKIVKEFDSTFRLKLNLNEILRSLAAKFIGLSKSDEHLH